VPIDLISLSEVARQLHVSVRTVKRRIEEADLTPARPGRAMLLTPSELNALVEYCRYRSKPAPTSPPVRRRGRYAKLAKRLSETFGPNALKVVPLREVKSSPFGVLPNSSKPIAR
jgi:excisionase family DNA binding protein